MLSKETLIGLLVVRAAMPAPGGSKGATPVYQPTFVPSQYQSEYNPYPFDRALNINAKGEALIVSCRGFYSGLPCTIYLWSPKTGVVRTPYNWMMLRDECVGANAVPVKMNERGEVAMNDCGAVSTWSAKTGKTSIGSLQPFTMMNPLAAFNDRGEIAGTTFISPYYRPYYASASTGPIVLPVSSHSQAVAMNKHGEMIGQANGGFYWSLSSGMIPVPMTTVRAIADDGTVVGVNGTALVLWDKHKGVAATAPLGASCMPFGITSKGLVIGTCGASAWYQPNSLWTWSAKSGFAPAVTLPATFTLSAMNDSGQVVGGLSGHAFTWSPEFGFVDLDPGRTDRTSAGLCIADDGTIGGIVGGRAVVWAVGKH
jgi:hypothetical protein